jgi:hypothetical protein
MRGRRSLVLIGFWCVSLALFGCGGGGGGSGNGGSNPPPSGGGNTPPPSGGGGNPPPATGTIGGTVSGTTVIAVDADGAILTSDDTAGRTANPAGAFAFSLASLPLHEDIRVFLISRGAIYPMFFDSNGDGSNDANVFSLDAQTTLDLGFVDTSSPNEHGKAIPTNDPSENAAFIARTPANPVIPRGLNEPVLAGLTADQMVSNGLKALTSGWVIGARAWFSGAVDTVGTGASSTAADTARLFYALTRVAAVGFDTLPDGDATDLDSAADFLDQLGVANDEVRGNWHLIALPSPLPADSPTSNDLRNFLYTTVGAEMTGAIENLDAIGSSFTTVLTNPIDQSEVEVDYSDVLVLRGALKSMLAAIAVLRAYDLDADVDTIVNTAVTAETFVASDATFLTLNDRTKLAEAKARLASGAIDDLKAAINSVRAETDNQSNDLITLDTLEDPTGAEALAFLDSVAQSIASGATAVGDKTLDLKRFFDTGVDFRSPVNLLPALAGNDVAGLLPDPTFAGVVVSPDLNEDRSPADGIPDVLQSPAR